MLVGDDARGTVTGASCAVAVAPHGYGERPHRIETIGVAYNDTSEARAALTVARGVAARTGSGIQALTVVSPASVGRWAGVIAAFEQAADDRLRSLDGVDGRVAVGFAGEELTAFGDQVDLLVVGSRGWGPLRRSILGSASVQLTREARCPLLVVPRPTVATGS